MRSKLAVAASSGLPAASLGRLDVLLIALEPWGPENQHVEAGTAHSWRAVAGENCRMLAAR